VLDSRSAERIKPRDAAAFAASERACAEVGWEYRLVTGHDPVWLANARWLATGTAAAIARLSPKPRWRRSPNSRR
jgi:hypothetical protein